MKPIDDHGGDPACWAHIFELDENDAAATAPTDLPAITREAADRGPAWTGLCDDLNVTLLVFHAGEGVADHVNTELDVLIVGITGEGLVKVNGEAHVLAVGAAIIVPKGAVRSTRATTAHFSYLTCHRRRGGLIPTKAAASSR